MATTTVAPRVSWIKHVGQVIGKIIGIITKDAKPEADIAAKVATALLPQFAPEIAMADNLVTKISLEMMSVEGVAAAAGTATGTGTQKMEQVVTAIQPALTQWVQNNFPGSKEVSAATSANVIQSIYDMIDQANPASVTTPAAATPTA
jgi:hypothetical protein